MKLVVPEKWIRRSMEIHENEWSVFADINISFFFSILWWRCKIILVLKFYVEMSLNVSCNVFKGRKLQAIIIWYTIVY